MSSRGMGFGVGAGATTLLAAVLAVSPGVHGAGTGASDEKVAKKTDRGVEESAGDKADQKTRRRVRVLAGGGGSYLGVRLEDLDNEDVSRLKLPEEKGALIKSVEEDSPAARAGLKADDVIVRYHGEGVLGAAQLSRLVRETPPGRVVPIEVMRGGSLQRLSATLGERQGTAWRLEGDHPEWTFELPEAPLAPLAPVPPVPPVPPPAFERWGKRALLDDLVWLGRGPRKLGIEYQEVEGQLAKYFKLSEESGVLVTSVEAEGPAGRAGVKAGDVILELDGRKIGDGEDLRRKVAKAEPGREVGLTVLRDGRSLELKITPGGERRRERADPGI